MKPKVLVTGGCGFVGREVVKQLLQKNYAVRAADNFSNSAPLTESDLLEVINIDLVKSEKILDLFKDVQYCIHLAASVGGIRYMNSSQSEILSNDILIDLNVIKAASLTNTKLIYASTVIVYDQSTKPPYKEEDLVTIPKSDYGFSKLVGERLCQAFGKDSKLIFSIARICNIYGINQNEVSEKKLHVVPDLIRKILRDKKFQLLGGGKQQRTFIHVSDVASALILMMETKASEGEVFNLGSEDKYQIIDLAKMIWKLLKKDASFIFEDTKIEGEDFINSILDVSKIRKKLGWEARQNLRDNLPEIVRWYSKIYG